MSERNHDADDGGAGFERRAKEAFERSVQGLDAATRSRLTQARHRAIEELEGGGLRRGWRRSLLPAGALAAAALVAVLVLRPGDPAGEPGIEQAAAVGDLEILLGDEDLEMYDEDIEFYAWLEEQPELAPPAAAGDGVG
jgi:hypothetical protein